MKHPKPWNYDPSTRDIRSAGGGFVCTVYCGDETAIEIVRAVNAHEALVGASNMLSKAAWELMVHHNGGDEFSVSDRDQSEWAVLTRRFVVAANSLAEALTLAKETT